MGVPFVDSDNVIHKCYEPSERTEKKPEQEPTQSSESKSSRKDLVGNCKEVRIDCNKTNLRIIGNGNKIRINRNSGNLDIVGNGTRVKITNNSGSIKYTGNSGRIYLGSDSSEQSVDYIGCNGILKVVKAMELRTDPPTTERRREKCKSSSSSYYCSSSDTESGRKSKSTESTHSSASASCCGFNIKNNISLPNLASSGCRKSANITNSINLSSSTGNIIIQNAINVAI